LWSLEYIYMIYEMWRIVIYVILEILWGVETYFII